jgi:NAD(P)-dependent dehydrogenase (short-subunit alcohol dehydrogenase family)
MFAYRGSTAMITGASKGLGAAFAKELAGRGMNLVLVARSIDALQDLADSLGAQCGWSKPRRVIAKVEWHPGELYPRVGLCHISGFYLLLLSSRRESGYAIPMP